MIIKNWFHKIIIIGITILSLIFLVELEILIIFGGVSEKIISLDNILMNLVKYFPIGILIFILVKELLQLFQVANQSLNFTLKDGGIVFIHNFNVWMALFETNSIKEIQIDELTQLNHLQTFSLELDINKSYLRLYIFSKKLNQLENRINKSRAILDIVLPDIRPVTNPNIENFLENNKFVNVNKKFFLVQNEEYLIAHTTKNTNQIPKNFTKLIMAYDSSKALNTTQIYFFNSYKKKKLFNLLENMICNDYQHSDRKFSEYQEVQRIRIRYQTKSLQKFSFDEALTQLKTGLAHLTDSFQSIEIGEGKAQIKFTKRTMMPNERMSQTNSFKTKEIITKVINDVLSEEKNSRFIPMGIKIVQEAKEITVTQ